MNLDEFYSRALVIGQDIHTHLPNMRSHAALTDAQQIIEIGVANANSSSAWLMGLRDTGGRLWSVDICPTELSHQLEDVVPDWTFVEGDSLTNHTAAPYDVDILFIDSEHSYAQTMAELELYAPHVRPGGTIWLHDTNNGEARVREALNDWCPAHNVSWVDNPECYGMGVVQL
jgi:cephalosporin hydroxylase